jgi:hypothetical protein
VSAAPGWSLLEEWPKGRKKMDNSVRSDARRGDEELDIYATPRGVTFEECYFYHHMDLPGVGEVGSGWDLRPTVDAYLGNLDFRGKRVLDVGAQAGSSQWRLAAPTWCRSTWFTDPSGTSCLTTRPGSKPIRCSEKPH